MNSETPTHDIVHASFSSLRRFVAHKKSRYKLMGNRFKLSHGTMLSTVRAYAME